MKKIVIAIVAILFALASFGQTDVYRSAYFNGTDHIELDNTDWANISTSAGPATFSMWVKIDSMGTSNEYLLHVPGGSVTDPVAQNVVAMYISSSDTLHCIYGNNAISTYFGDTNWHHVAFICDTIAGQDTLCIYIDGVYQTGRTFAHTNINNWSLPQHNMYAGCHAYFNISYHVYTDLYYTGNMCKFSIADSAMYDSYPDCVFDTTMFWSGGTISAPYTMLMAMSTDSNFYLPNTMYAFSGDTVIGTHFSYTYGTSPCAPSYTFYCPAHIDSTVYTHQTNKYYKKGANMLAHRNGWDTSIVTSVTYGVFTDSLLITAAGTYQYTDDYRTVLNLDTTIVVTTTGIKQVQLANGTSIYPNPSTGEINIVPTNPIELTIYDLTGHLVYNAFINNKTLLALTPGMYLCTMLDNTTSEKHTAKILIE